MIDACAKTMLLIILITLEFIDFKIIGIMKHIKPLKMLLWIARIWGAISLMFLLFMVGAHLVDALFVSKEPIGEGFNSTTEMISFLFFPISSMLGLGIAFKWHRIGGLITTIGIIGFHFFRPDLLFNPMIDGLAFPGLLFLMYSFLNNSKAD